jgi:hypothetical protein
MLTIHNQKPIWPTRNWFLWLGIIVMYAALLRYTGYNFSLPFIDHADEPAYNLAGRMIIDFGSAKPLGMQGYPPGIVELNYLILRFFQQPNTQPSSILWIMRLISITVSLITIVLLALLTYRISTPMAGLITAGIWAISPQIVDYSRFATADNFVTCFTVLAIFLVITGTLYSKYRNWVYLGSIASSFAVIFKYQAALILPILVLFPLLLLFQPNANRRVVLAVWFKNLLIQGIFFSWLFLFFPVAEASNSPYWSAAPLKLGLPQLSTLSSNFAVVTEPFYGMEIAPIGYLGILLLLWKPLCRRVDLHGFFAVLAMLGSWFMGVSFFGKQDFRQFVAVSALLTIIIAVGLTLWITLTQRLLEQSKATVNYKQWVTRLLILMLIISLSPHISDAINNAYQHTLPDLRNELADWADKTLPSGKYIAWKNNHKTFNGPWGGYTGKTEFPLAEIADVNIHPVETWREMGVAYAIVPFSEYEAMRSTPEGQTQLSQMTLLKTFPPRAAYRGPDMAVFRLYPIQHEINKHLGPIRIVGYDLDHSEVHAGDSITFTLYWQALALPDAEYAVFNHLLKGNTVNITTDDIVAQIDGSPLLDVRRPTNTWNDPNEILISQKFTLTIQNDTPPGVYRLVSGFYRRNTGVRLLTPNNHDAAEIAKITVQDDKVILSLAN